MLAQSHRHAFIAWLYFITKTNRKEALQLLQTAGPENTNVTNTYVCAMVLIWNNKFREGIQYARDFMENSEMITRFHMGIEPYLMLLIAKKQYDYIYTLFAENRYNIRDVYKPIYYALMRLMKDIYPDEHKRMGEEISLTVDEVLGQIRQMAVDYAI